MSNRADIDSTTAALLEKDNQILFYAVKAEFDTETLRFWTGDTDITINRDIFWTRTAAADLRYRGQLRDQIIKHDNLFSRYG